ncbi:hypothetical protein BJ508DRAFT_417969 [Ascobolus immersus RN42]|uniref:Uncharacterized protein n=1 Tax=Ascobolus immersus RN42 TaxID=1160509 RepID=A0A3N4HUZ5_ASCIM|nr:hypothetical protein BJ508DRAFT_417969 [Ascobolus immersus RN42]
MLRVSKKKYTYVFAKGQDQDELRLGNLVLRDFTNAFNERSYKHRSLSPRKEKLHSNIARLEPESSYDGQLVRDDTVKLAFAWDKEHTKVIIAESGVVARLRDPTDFLNEVLLRRPAAFKVLIRWLAAANGMLKAADRCHGFTPRPPKIWMLTGLTLLTNATATIKQNRFLGRPAPEANNTVILDQTSSNTKRMDGTLIWAVEWQMLDVNEVLAIPGRGMEVARIRRPARPAVCHACARPFDDKPASLVEYPTEEDTEDELAGVTHDPDDFDLALDAEIRRYERTARKRVSEERRSSESEETGTLVDSEEAFEHQRPTPPVMHRSRYGKPFQGYRQPEQLRQPSPPRRFSRPASPAPMTEDFVEPPPPTRTARDHHYSETASSLHPNVGVPNVEVYEPEYSDPSDNEMDLQRQTLIQSKLDHMQELVDDSTAGYPQMYPTETFEIYEEGEPGYERTTEEEGLDDNNKTAWGESYEHRQKQFYETESYIAEAARESYAYERTRYGYTQPPPTYTPTYPTYPTKCYPENTYSKATPAYAMPIPPVTVQPVSVSVDPSTPPSPRRKPWDIPAPLGGKRYHSSGGYGQPSMARSFPPHGYGAYPSFVEPVEDDVPVYGGHRYGRHSDDAYVGYRGDYLKAGYDSGRYGGYTGYGGYNGRRWGRGRVECDETYWGY